MSAAAVEDSSKKRGLGRGLSALFGDDDPDMDTATVSGPAPKSTKTIPIELLRPNPTQPRKRFDDTAIDGLVDSIRQKGILQPLLVRPHPDDANAYEIVAGERRWRAAQRAQLHDIPVVIKELSERDTLEIALIENIHREDLTPLEEAEGYQRLMEEFGHTQDALAKSVGKSRSHVANMMRLLNLPEEVKSMLDDGLISAGHARALLSAPNADAIAQQVIKNGYNVRQTERLIQDAKPGGGKTGDQMRKLKSKIAPSEAASGASGFGKDPNTVAMERSLTDSLGMAVAIDLKPDGEAGRLVVSFDNLDQLDDLLDRLNQGAKQPDTATVTM